VDGHGHLFGVPLCLGSQLDPVVAHYVYVVKLPGYVV
jgi:hypothetical protein